MSEIYIKYSQITDVHNSSIPKRIGAYVITHTFDNLHAERYVGSTKNLFIRMYGHYDKNIIYVELYITDDVELAESLERILMELIKPATNKLIPPLSEKDREIMNELLRNTDIKERTSNNIVKVGYRCLKYINKHNDNRARKPRVISNKRIISHERKVTIPEGLGLNPDDAIEFIVSNDGTIIIKKLE